MFVTGTGIQDGTMIKGISADGVTATVSKNLGVVVGTASATDATTTLTLDTITSGVPAVGMVVTGTGIVAGTTVSAVSDTTGANEMTVTLSTAVSNGGSDLSGASDIEFSLSGSTGVSLSFFSDG